MHIFAAFCSKGMGDLKQLIRRQFKYSKDAKTNLYNTNHQIDHQIIEFKYCLPVTRGSIVYFLSEQWFRLTKSSSIQREK